MSVSLNPRSVFTGHLDTIRLFSGAQIVDFYHPGLHPTLQVLSVGRDDDSAAPLCTAELELLEILPQQDSPQGGPQFIANGLKSLAIRVCETDVEVGLGSPALPGSLAKPVMGDGDPDPAKKSRRTPIQQFIPDIWYWIVLTYAEKIPDWLDAAKNDILDVADNQPLVALKQLFTSASLQLRLVQDHMNLLSDPLTLLSTRATMQYKLTLLGRQHSMGLLLIHCTDFHQINKKFSQDHGDNVIREIASNLKSGTREGDIIGRFGGALFAIGFPTNEQDDVTGFAKKLQLLLQQKRYLNGALTLNFNLGAALIEHEEPFKTETERTASLINRADQALQSAQDESQPSIITWQRNDFSVYQQPFQYLGGIFTADTVTDYRNMLLLWDISAIIADNHDFTQLLHSVVQRLAQTFDFFSAGLITKNDATHKDYIYSIDDNDNAVALADQNIRYLAELKHLQDSALKSTKPCEEYIDNNLLLVLPLEIQTADCFFICAQANKFTITHDTKVLIFGLTRQLGKALRRSRLEEELNRKLEDQNERLKQELVQLKEVLQSSSIIYQSAAMADLMKHAQRAAMTDMTVLITGESGTGKERLFHALHLLGKRNEKPLVIIDCGSIPETLIESELFGHVKGAFTGAQNTTTGKVMDADKGVLVLDEIGELPLQMQTKLLRFVQEKHFTQVGGNKLHKVDVKIIAVTNRDLAQDVEQGTFRKDLYYRLNVLTLHNPPLRDRLEDLPLLAQHFLNKFAKQFSLEKKTLSAEAMNCMRQYSWPGNIRELENRLMQATLLGDTNVISWALLNIDDEGKEPVVWAKPQELAASATISSGPITPKAQEQTPTSPPSAVTNSDARGPEAESFPDPQTYLSHLAQVLHSQISTAAEQAQFFNAPFGTWIEDELILQTYLASNRKMRLTAARLSISQSTARRRVDKIMADNEHAQSVRPENWQHVTTALSPLSIGQVLLPDCINKIKLLILKVILQIPACSLGQAAEMLGVSQPTFYKLKKELELTSQ